LFQNVASFLTLGFQRVAMQLKCDRIFNDHFISRLLLSLLVKEFWQ